MKLKHLMFALAVVIGIAWPASAQVRVVNETFSGPLSQAFVTQKCPVVVYNGENVAECNWDGVLPWTDPAKYKDMAIRVPGSGAMLVQVDVLLDADIDVNDGSKLFRFGPTGQVNLDFYVVCQFEKGTSPSAPSGGADILISDGGRTMWGRDGSWRPLANVDCYQRNVWYKFAVYVDATEVRFFWNDKLIQVFPAVAGKPYLLTGEGREFYMPSNWSSNVGWEHDSLNRTRWRNLRAFTMTGTGEPVTSGTLRDNTAMVSGGTSPLPSNCEGTWSTPVLSDPTPLVCDATQVQTRTSTSMFTVTKLEANGGTCVERTQSPRVTTVTDTCVYVPPPPPPLPSIVGRFASQTTYTGGLRVTLRVPPTQALPPTGRAIRLRVPVVGGFEERAGTVRSTKANAYSGGDGQIVIEMPGLSALTLDVILP